jgi:ribosomal-protein-serine acetyltransferase
MKWACFKLGSGQELNVDGAGAGAAIVRSVTERAMNTITFPGRIDDLTAGHFGGTATMPSSQQAVLTQGDVGIRRFCREDIGRLHEATCESMNELCTWMVWCHPDYSIMNSAAFVLASEAKWEQEESFSFAIVDSRNGEFLGSAGLSQVNRLHNVANLGYWVRSGRTGRGIASAAVRLVAGFGLQELGFNRLEMVIPTENLASQRVAQKAGARREGVLRNKLMLGGKLRDAEMYSLVLADYAMA